MSFLLVNNVKKLMVLAAGLLQIPVIKKAREMGYYVIAVDDDPRACYFKQVLNGKYIRMALILKLLEEAQK